MRRAKDLMRKDLTSISENAPLKQAADALAQKKLSGMPVVNKNQEIVGFISEKDIIVSVFPESLKFENPEILPLQELAPHIKKLSQAGSPVVKDFMSETLYSVTEDTPLTDLLELMLTKDLKRLPVVRGKHLVGVIERSAVSKFSQERSNIK